MQVQRAAVGRSELVLAVDRHDRGSVRSARLDLERGIAAPEVVSGAAAGRPRLSTSAASASAMSRSTSSSPSIAASFVAADGRPRRMKNCATLEDGRRRPDLGPEVVRRCRSATAATKCSNTSTQLDRMAGDIEEAARLAGDDRARRSLASRSSAIPLWVGRRRLRRRDQQVLRAPQSSRPSRMRPSVPSTSDARVRSRAPRERSRARTARTSAGLRRSRGSTSGSSAGSSASSGFVRLARQRGDVGSHIVDLRGARLRLREHKPDAEHVLDGLQRRTRLARARARGRLSFETG